MEKICELSEGRHIIFTDEPARAQQLSAAGSCFIAAGSGCAGADAYVERPEDLDELPEDFLERVYARHAGVPARIAEGDAAGIHVILRECCEEDLSEIREIYRDCPEAFDERCRAELASGDEENAGERFMESMRSYYRATDLGLWIAEADGVIAGVAGLTAGESGPELGIALKKEWRGRGLAAGICNMALDYAENSVAAGRVLLRCSKKNRSCILLAERLGMKLAGDNSGLGADVKASVSEFVFAKEF